MKMPDASPQEPAATMVSRWLDPRPGLIVWDFDLTVLNTHAFGEGVEVEDVSARWHKDVRDLELFKLFVETAVKEGSAVGVASYGRKDVIAEYMRHIFAGSAQQPFTPANIVTPSAFGVPDGACPVIHVPTCPQRCMHCRPTHVACSAPIAGTSIPSGKPQMLDMLRQVATVQDRSAVIFFDDDPENVTDCQAAGYKRTFHTPDGFSRQQLRRLESGSNSRRCVVE